ncbi:hypothetical protein OCU04_011100 [Sclerotinia nivalis]|uniref:Uncharacterized protein n=1 Tax=Sclerotinia nivalis TaxID=352851 RepID=A0A9X0AAW4_9HELO|nr:hypothetical protein OCU04_011100 [Sclerotinia nivalis]
MEIVKKGPEGYRPMPAQKRAPPPHLAQNDADAWPTEFNLYNCDIATYVSTNLLNRVTFAEAMKDKGPVVWPETFPSSKGKQPNQQGFRAIKKLHSSSFTETQKFINNTDLFPYFEFGWNGRLFCHFPFATGTASLPPCNNGKYTLYDMKGWDVVIDAPYTEEDLERGDPAYEYVRDNVNDSDKFDFYQVLLKLAEEGRWSNLARTSGLPSGAPRDEFFSLLKEWIANHLKTPAAMFIWNLSTGLHPARPFVPTSRNMRLGINYAQDWALEASANAMIFQENCGGNPPTDKSTGDPYTSLDGFVQVGMELFWFRYLLSSDTNLLYAINKATNLEAVWIEIKPNDRYQRKYIQGYNPNHGTSYYDWDPYFNNPRFRWSKTSTATDWCGIGDHVAETDMTMTCTTNNYISFDTGSKYSNWIKIEGESEISVNLTKWFAGFNTTDDTFSVKASWNFTMSMNSMLDGKLGWDLSKFESKVDPTGPIDADSVRDMQNVMENMAADIQLFYSDLSDSLKDAQQLMLPPGKRFLYKDPVFYYSGYLQVKLDYDDNMILAEETGAEEGKKGDDTEEDKGEEEEDKLTIG